MVGIKSFSAYIPFFRLSRKEIAQFWNGFPGKGEKAVANFDEDSITMAVESSMNCISGFDTAQIDELYFASTSSPYKEKQASALISTALDLRKDVFTVDLAGSLRSGMSAVKTAVNSIKAGSANDVLVCASDIRLGFPKGSYEMDFGDGGAALLLGKDKVVAQIVDTYSVADEINDIWRSDKDTFVLAWEERFVREKGYLRVLVETASAAMKKFGLEPKDISKAVLYAPNGKLISGAARKLGFDMKTQVQDTLYAQMGNTGTALAPMLLAAALETAKPGDKILWAGYGDGSDVMLLEVTDEIKNYKVKRSVEKQLNEKKMITYQKFLSWRELLQSDPPARPPLEKPSAVSLWRDSRKGLSLTGVKCLNCGTPQYPSQRVCFKCKTKDQFERYRFADKLGKLVTFSHDNLAPSLDPPTTVGAVDYEGGGRVMTEITDREMEEIKVDMSVRMSFRRFRVVGSIYDYWWKGTPVR